MCTEQSYYYYLIIKLDSNRRSWLGWGVVLELQRTHLQRLYCVRRKLASGMRASGVLQILPRLCVAAAGASGARKSGGAWARNPNGVAGAAPHGCACIAIRADSLSES